MLCLLFVSFGVIVLCLFGMRRLFVGLCACCPFLLCFIVVCVFGACCIVYVVHDCLYVLFLFVAFLLVVCVSVFGGVLLVCVVYVVCFMCVYCLCVFDVSRFPFVVCMFVLTFECLCVCACLCVCSFFLRGGGCFVYVCCVYVFLFAFV